MEENISINNPHCTFPAEQCSTLDILNLVTNCLAIVMLIAALASAGLLRIYQSFQQRILIHILSSSLLYAVCLIIPNKDEYGNTIDDLCEAQGFLIQVLGMVMVLWVCVLSSYLYYGFVKGKDISQHERSLVAVCWLVPIAIGIIPFVTRSYGPASNTPYCWINNEKKGAEKISIGDIFRFGLYWIPVFLVIVAILILFIYMLYLTRKSRRENPRFVSATYEVKHVKRVEKYLQPLAGYAVAFVIIHALMVGNRIQNLINSEPIYGLVIAHLFSGNIYGPVLATIYFITSGRKTFTLAKFKRSIYYYTHKSCCKKEKIVRSLAVSNHPFSTIVPAPIEVYVIDAEVKECPEESVPEQHFSA